MLADGASLRAENDADDHGEGHRPPRLPAHGAGHQTLGNVTVDEAADGEGDDDVGSNTFEQ